MAIKPVHRAVERLMRSAQIRRHKIRVLVGIETRRYSVNNTESS